MLFAAASVFIYYTAWTILLVSRNDGHRTYASHSLKIKAILRCY